VSPTSRLIDFRRKRFEDKKALARKITLERSFERLLVYSNRPRLKLETSLRKLEYISRQYNNKKNKRIEDQVEKSLAKELLPALEETVALYKICE
jgi:HEPN domain-containing protein